MADIFQNRKTSFATATALPGAAKLFLSTKNLRLLHARTCTSPDSDRPPAGRLGSGSGRWMACEYARKLETRPIGLGRRRPLPPFALLSGGEGAYAAVLCPPPPALIAASPSTAMRQCPVKPHAS